MKSANMNSISMILIVCVFLIIPSLALSSGWRTVFTKDEKLIQCPDKESPDIVKPMQCFDSDGNEIRCPRNLQATWRTVIKPDEQCHYFIDRHFDNGNELIKIISCGIHDQNFGICLKLNATISEEDSHNMCEFIATKFESEYSPPLKHSWELILYSVDRPAFILARCSLYKGLIF